MFRSGNLYEILKRKVYIGKIEHKGQVYDGVHEPIIDLETFNKVQELLKENNQSHERRYKAEQPSLLASKLYDDNDFIMSPSHATKRSACGTVKNGKRYRYYLSQVYLRKQKELAGSLPQVPANELEEHTTDLVKSKLTELLQLDNYSIEQYELFKENLDKYFESWNIQNKETHFVIRSILNKVMISHINVIYYLNTKALEDIFNLIITKKEIMNYELTEIIDEECEIIILPCELKRVNMGKTLIIGDQTNLKNDGVVGLLKQAWKWSDLILKGISTNEISVQEKVSSGYIRKVLKLRFLSPQIQKMILLGERLDILTSHNLRTINSLDFQEQEKQLGL